MKPIKNKLRVLALAAGSLAITIAGANAQNTHYAAGDLVLYFQKEGSSNTVYADLGNAATLFRGAATGPDAANRIDFMNINSVLSSTSAFGTGWASLTNLYMGVAGVYGTSSTSSVVTSGDPQRTIYVGQSRPGVGTVGTPGTGGGYDLTWTGDDGAMSTAASDIKQMLIPFADATGANGFNAAAVYSTSSSTSNITAQNPFLMAGIQGNAFETFSGGVQQVGGTFAAGTSFGSVSNVSFALDLYRIQARNDLVQVGAGQDPYVGTYEGTITLNNTGSISFQAVPEPSTYALFGISALGIGFVVARRRKLANNNA